MTSKLSWIPFIPLTIAAAFFKLAQYVLPDGSILGLSDMALDYLTIGCAVAVFLGSLILCVADRRISVYYQAHRNIPAGIFALLLALICAADGANQIYLSLSAGKVEALQIVEAVLLLLASIIFIVYGMTHAFVNRDNKHFALFNLMPALLCAVRLVRCFVSFTTISIRMADVTLLFCYVFATLFFFNLAVTISLTEAKHAVKSCFIFGFPAATMLIAYSIHAFASSFNADDLLSNAVMAELMLMALYIISFLLEMTIFIKDRDQVTIKTGEEADDIEIEEEDINDANYVLRGTQQDDSDEPEDAYGYLRSADISDYLIDVVEKPDAAEQEQIDQSDATGYIMAVEKPDKTLDTPVVELQEEVASEETADADYTSTRLDEIDKLILELSEDYHD